MNQHPHARLDTRLDAQPLTPAEVTTDALAALRQRTAAVRAMGAALGLDAARLARGEALDRLEVTATLPAEDILAWPADKFREPFAILGADLALDLTLSGAESLSATPITATLRASDDPASALAAFHRAASDLLAGQGDDLTVEARLAVAKRDALAATHPLIAAESVASAPPTAITLFYFAAAWERLLTLADLPLWSQRGLLPVAARARVLLGDATGHLAGPALEIIGAATPEPLRPLPISRATWRQFSDRVATYTRLRDEEGHWSAPPLPITPAHLDVISRVPGLEATAHCLATLREALAAAYLASATAGSWESGLELRFAGARPATCLLPSDTGKNGNPIPSTPNHRNPSKGGNHTSQVIHESDRIGNPSDNDDPRESGKIGNNPATDDLDAALTRLAHWAFAHGSPDKLAIARECLARELPAGATITLADLKRAALPTLDAAKFDFASYLRGRTEQYFKLRQSAQDAVAAYVETVRRAVADLASDAVESLYRTAGLIVALVVAWLIQPAASRWTLPLGALLLSVYIAFILWLVLPAREDRYRLESAALARRLSDMELDEAPRARLLKSVSGDNAYFARYLARARRITWGLLILGIVAFLVFCFGPPLAHLVAASPAGSPTVPIRTHAPLPPH